MPRAHPPCLCKRLAAFVLLRARKKRARDGRNCGRILKPAGCASFSASCLSVHVSSSVEQQRIKARLTLCGAAPDPIKAPARKPRGLTGCPYGERHPRARRRWREAPAIRRWAEPNIETTPASPSLSDPPPPNHHPLLSPARSAIMPAALPPLKRQPLSPWGSVPRAHACDRPPSHRADVVRRRFLATRLPAPWEPCLATREPSSTADKINPVDLCSFVCVLVYSLVYPLDTIKTRIQASAGESEDSTSSVTAPGPADDDESALSTAEREAKSKAATVLASAKRKDRELVASLIDVLKGDVGGLLAFYKGFGASMLNTFSMQYAYFFFYSLVRGLYARRLARLRGVSGKPATMGTAAELLLGALAGALAQIFTIPVAVIGRCYCHSPLVLAHGATHSRSYPWVSPSSDSSAALRAFVRRRVVPRRRPEHPRRRRTYGLLAGAQAWACSHHQPGDHVRGVRAVSFVPFASSSHGRSHS